ncbi:glycosyltransferase family 2 protein [bacterium]|nr:glycosyltransferase family 2 protein [candidate division CSSED10-310 bacterium]
MSESSRRLKTVVVMPAYNAGPTLLRTYQDVPREWVDLIILVDDCSQDDTVELASGLDIQVIAHGENRGYGGNQKTCYRNALDQGADIIIMLHPDYQYDPRIIPRMISPIADGEADIVFASRFLGNPLEGNMPLYKYISNRLLTWLQNRIQGTGFSEFHTGYRAYSRKALETIPFSRNSDGFVFDNEIIIQGLIKGMRFVEVPVETRYERDSSTVSFKGSLLYGIRVLRNLTRFLLHKHGIKRYAIFE